MMNRILIGMSLLLGMACQNQPDTAAEAEQAEPVEVPADLPDELSTYLDEIGYNGALLLAQKGVLIHEGAYGTRDPRDESLLEVNTPFYLASVSKQITAMTVMILVEREKLRFDERLSTFFPEFPFADSVTVFHMLTHTSGIPDYYDVGAFKEGMTNEDVRQAVLAQPRLNFAPGSAYEYSNSAYVLLSMIVTRLSGMPFREFVQQNIFAPLDMTQSVVYDETQPEVPSRAIGFTTDGKLLDYDAFTTGGGGIFSTVGDLLKWERALYADALVSEEMMQQAYQPTKLSNGKLSYYGFGWRLVEGMPDRVFHTGALAGFRTMVLRDLKTEWVLIMLTNNENEELEAISEQLYDMCAGTNLF